MARVAVIAGDGIGPEVIAEATATLTAAAPGSFELVHLPFGADHTLATGRTATDEDLLALERDFDAVLLGALGDPRIPDGRHARDLLLGARMRLDLYVNLRPTRLLDARLCPLAGRTPADVDLVVFRENTEELYVDIGGSVRRGTPDEIATNLMVATWRGTERIIRRAFEHAMTRPRKTVCLVTKSNAVTHVWGLWERAFKAVAADFPEVRTDRLYADVAALELVRRPARFDVIVASNLLGDILSDLASQIAGGLGLAPSANLRPAEPGRKAFGLFEPVHGSAPDLVGTARANPLGAILSAAMLARSVGLGEVADRIERAVTRSVTDGQTTPDLGGSLTTSQAGAAVRRSL
ncbi:MAG: isocitrate/isopropylmalate dehydrogenase family protein [Deltaproteobacteria bacterium]|nr:isocitrate/isopropylmalate dehydrogenase family protein [Deltaproteobacteria bacterium]